MPEQPRAAEPWKGKGSGSRVRDWDAYGRTLDRIIARERRRQLREERRKRKAKS